mgnify:CR=1 FL=1
MILITIDFDNSQFIKITNIYNLRQYSQIYPYICIKPLQLTMFMELFVKKTDTRTEEKSLREIHQILEKSAIEWHAIDRINWSSHTYKPLAEFRIMHSKDEILLEFHVKKEGARAVYDYDAAACCYRLCQSFDRR